MFRLTSEHLSTIFGIIEFDGEGIAETLNYLNLPINNENLTLQSLSPSASNILVSYLERQRGFPSKNSVRYNEVQQTINFTAQLCLLMDNDLSNQLNSDRLLKLFTTHLLALAQTATNIFKQNNLESQLFLLIKIHAFKNKDYVQHNAIILDIINRSIQDLAAICNNSLTTLIFSKEQDKVLYNYIRFICSTAELPDQSTWLNQFIKKTQDIIENTPDYTLRNEQMKQLFVVWHQIKDQLAIEHLDWIIRQVDILQRAFSPWRKTMSYYTNRHFNLYNLGITCFVFAIFLYLDHIILKLAHNDINTINRKILELRVKHPDLAIEGQLEKHTNLTAALQNHEFILSLQPYFLIFIAASGLLVNFSFANTTSRLFPAHNRTPVSIPTWCLERRQALQNPHLMHT